MVSSRTTERADVLHAATPDRKAKDVPVQQQSKIAANEPKKLDSLPPIELISLASPEIDSKSDSVEFGNFLGASMPAAAATTTTTAAASSTTGASSDLAELDFFSGIVSQPGGGAAGANSGPVTKDDIMALYGPSNSSSVFGVPGGMYMPRQPVMCQSGMQQPAGVAYPVMSNGVPMIQPMMGVAPIVPQVNGSLGQVPVTAPPAYGFFQGYPQAQMQPGTCQVVPSTGVMWCPPAANQQPQHMVAGHTMSNVLWQ